MSEYDWDAFGERGPWVSGPPREVIEPLPVLNAYCLDTLVEQTRAGGTHAAASQIAQMWLALDAAARRRLTGHPYLLFDAGFADPHRWRDLDRAQVCDVPYAGYEELRTTPRSIAGAQFVFCYAWSIAGRYAIHARLALGMHPQCAEQIAAHTVLGMLQLAHRLAGWLRPRWLRNPEVWEDLMRGAAEGGAAHTRARLQGMRLMAADLAAALRQGGRS